MNAQETFVMAENALQGGGRVLLEVTAVLVLSYLLIFAGSLLVAAVRHTRARHGQDPGRDDAQRAPNPAHAGPRPATPGTVTVPGRR